MEEQTSSFRFGDCEDDSSVNIKLQTALNDYLVARTFSSINAINRCAYERLYDTLTDCRTSRDIFDSIEETSLKEFEAMNQLMMNTGTVILKTVNGTEKDGSYLIGEDEARTAYSKQGIDALLSYGPVIPTHYSHLPEWMWKRRNDKVMLHFLEAFGYLRRELGKSALLPVEELIEIQKCYSRIRSNTYLKNIDTACKEASAWPEMQRDKIQWDFGTIH